MSRRFWFAIMAALLVCLVMAFVAAQISVSTVGEGTEAARVLQERLRAACSTAAAADPPLRVFAMLPGREGEGWRWKVEATLREGLTPSDPRTGRALERIVALCLTSPIRGKPPAGLLVVLHQPGKPDWTRSLDGQGRPVLAAPGGPR